MGCTTCEYTGWVMCLKAPALRHIADNWLETGLPLFWWMHCPSSWFAAVACNCLSDADAVAAKHKTVVYDPLRTCKLWRNTSEQNGMERDRWILDFVERRLKDMGTVAASIDDWSPPAGATYQGGAW